MPGFGLENPPVAPAGWPEGPPTADLAGAVTVLADLETAELAALPPEEVTGLPTG